MFAACDSGHEIKLEQQAPHPLDIEACSVVRVVILAVRGLRQTLVALLDILGIVEVATIRRNPEVIPHVLCTRHFLTAQQHLVQLLAVARSDYLDLVIRLANQRQNSVGKRFDRGSRRLLYKNITVVAMFEGIQDKFNRIDQRHHEPRHRRIGNGNRHP